MDNHGKSWTLEQHHRMLKLYVERGLSPPLIAEHMGRQTDSILAQFEKLRLCSEVKEWPKVQRSKPYPADHTKVLTLLAHFDQACKGVHHRGPDDASGWTDLPKPQTQSEEQTMSTEFFVTKHYIAGVDVTEINDGDLIKAIRRETSELAELAAIRPLPKRIAKLIEVRKAKLDEAIAFLDAQEA